VIEEFTKNLEKLIISNYELTKNSVIFFSSLAAVQNPLKNQKQKNK